MKQERGGAHAGFCILLLRARQPGIIRAQRYPPRGSMGRGRSWKRAMVRWSEGGSLNRTAPSEDLQQSKAKTIGAVLHVTPRLSECSYVFRQLHAVTRCGSVGVSSRRRIDRGARKEERPESSEASCSKGLKG